MALWRETHHVYRMTEFEAKFAPGQLVVHELFEYRGVVIDVDPYFKGSDSWYEQMAKSKPPKTSPWYHVLVDGAEMQTYVAERNLSADESGHPIEHPDLADHFDGLGEDGYFRQVN